MGNLSETLELLQSALKTLRKKLDQHESTVAPAKEQVENFLNGAEKYKYGRIKELFNILSDEEIHEYVLPFVSKRKRPYDVLESQCFPSVSKKENISKTLLQTNPHSFLTTVNSNYGRELEYVLNLLGYGKINVRHELSFTRCLLSSHSGTSQTPSVGLRSTFNLQSKCLLPFMNDISSTDDMFFL